MTIEGINTDAEDCPLAWCLVVLILNVGPDERWITRLGTESKDDVFSLLYSYVFVKDVYALCDTSDDV